MPLLYVDVNLGQGRTGRIGIYRGDDPVVLAHNFATTYQLDEAQEVTSSSAMSSMLDPNAGPLDGQAKLLDLLQSHVAQLAEFGPGALTLPWRPCPSPESLNP